MSNAVSTEPQIPGGGVSASGQNLHGAAAIEGRRRISADSFKLLTARLKSGGSPSARPVSAAPAPVIPVIEVETHPDPPSFGPLPVQADPVMPPEAAELEKAEKPVPAAALPAEAVEVAFNGSEPDPAGAPALALPQFNPLQWQEQTKEPTAGAVVVEELEERPAASDIVSGAQHPQGVEVVELPAFQPVEAFCAVDAPSVAEDLFGEETAIAEQTASGHVEAEMEPDIRMSEADYLPVTLASTAGFADIESDQETIVTETIPEIIESVIPEFPAHEDSANGIHAEKSFGDGVAADDVPAPEPAVDEAQEPNVLAAEPELLRTGDEAAARAPQELAEAVAETEVEQAEPQADAAPLEVVPPPETAQAPSAEAKHSTSEMAGRVVDAMLKTISTAIYAKPSSAERAAFVKEMASLMQEAANAAGNSEAQAHPVDLPDSLRPIEPAQAGAVPAKAENSVAEAIAERIGPSASPILKTGKPQDDPFASVAVSARLATPRPVETADADEESGELAMKLLDMMSGGTGSLPHERTLAADTLLRILPRIPVKQLLSVVERVAIMEAPPPLLVAKLIRDTRAEIVAPLLERCSHISDQDLMNAAPDGDAPKLRMIARRRTLSTVLSDYLIATEDAAVLLILIRNPGAALSHEAFFRLAELATQHHGLLAPLATRADLPPPVAFELFWHVPPELRRFIFSRFLTDSETLNKILRITLATHGEDSADPTGDMKFPAREAVEVAIGQAAAFKIEDASQAFAEMAGVNRATIFRILSDVEGEPVTVLLKALGCSRARFEESLTRLRLSEAGILRPDRNPDELQAIFDGLSFNKARILLTYWDWFVRKAGPYAPHN